MIQNFNRVLIFLIVTSLFVLASCSPPYEERDVAVRDLQTKNRNDALASAEDYLQMSYHHSPPKSFEYTLMAIEMFLEANEMASAKHWLHQVPENVPEYLQIHRNVLNAQISLQEKNFSQAAKSLRAITQINQLTPSQKQKVFYMRAVAFEQMGDALKSSQARAHLDQFLENPKQREANREALWAMLAQIPIDQLQHAQTLPDRYFAGWAKLALIYRTERVSGFESAMYQWQQEFPQHPAKRFMQQPQEIGNFPTHIHQVALLLPLSGNHKKAAEAIREGFLARYYAQENAANKPIIKVYDTTAHKNIRNLYLDAVEQGANFVVGPLMKEDVLELSTLAHHQMKAPILALNNSEKILRSPGNFFQFALDPEDEAEQIAEKVWQDNYRHPAILVPNNKWGQRVLNSFDQRWKGFGGTLTTAVRVGTYEDHDQAVRKLLNIDKSMERSNIIKSSIREKVQIEPRRRQDIDVIILATPPEQARQLKPLLNFYYAHDLPVYATSSVYTGQKDPDMNGVIFCDMPWLLIDHTKQQLINNQETTSNETNLYTRLFAMGVDAYDLSTEIQHLHQEPYKSHQGATGFLTLGNNHKIQRKLVWAEFKNGEPRRLQ